MPEAAENLAAEHAILCADQDRYALRSQSRYDAAWHARDILRVTLAGRKGDTVATTTDEHPRATSLDRLSALPTPLRAGGTVTASNAAGINDGASALLLASAAGVAPRIMGIGPVAAVERLLDRSARARQRRRDQAERGLCRPGLGLHPRLGSGR